MVYVEKKNLAATENNNGKDDLIKIGTGGDAVHRDHNIIHINHFTLEYTVYGKGTPILVFHGGHSNCHEEFGYESLQTAGYSIITPSRAGYGTTSPISDLKQACYLYKKILDHLAIDKVHVIAISAGGPTGITFCSLFPELVMSFVLQSAVTMPWLTKEDKEYRVASKIFAPQYEKKTWGMLKTLCHLSPALTLRMMTSSFSKLPYREVKRRFNARSIHEFCRMISRQRSYGGFLLDLEQTQIDYSDQLAVIKAPTLVMHSQNDSSVSILHPENAIALIPYTEVCILDSWGHLIWIGREASDYDHALIHFLARHSSTDY